MRIVDRNSQAQVQDTSAISPTKASFT
jgi:O6-methylguanine-DNA--protein-cysteine methyltransferase